MAGLLAGVDLGGTSIKAALADESGRVLAREVIPTESHRQAEQRFNGFDAWWKGGSYLKGAVAVRAAEVGLLRLSNDDAGRVTALGHGRIDFRGPVAAWVDEPRKVVTRFSRTLRAGRITRHGSTLMKSLVVSGLRSLIAIGSRLFSAFQVSRVYDRVSSEKPPNDEESRKMVFHM